MMMFVDRSPCHDRGIDRESSLSDCLALTQDPEMGQVKNLPCFFIASESQRE